MDNIYNIDEILDSLDEFSNVLAKLRNLLDIAKGLHIDFLDLLENERICEYIEEVFEFYGEDIKLGLIGKHIKEASTIDFIELYCIKEGIKISSVASENVSDDYISEDNFDLYMKDVDKTALLSPEKEREIISRLPDQDAVNELVESNLRLVFYVINTYFSWAYKFEKEDLIQAGNLGLIEAAVNFDKTRKNRFSTYAVPKIRQKIKKCINEQHPVLTIPTNLKDELNKFSKIINDGKTMGLSFEEINKIACEELHVDLNTLATYRRILHENYGISMNNPLDGCEDNFSEVLSSDIKGPEDEGLASDLRLKLFDAMKCLSEKERKVMLCKYGFDDGINKTLEETGEKFGLTRERIRQIEATSLNKLRNPKYTKTYVDYCIDPEKSKFKKYNMPTSGYKYKKNA